MVYFANSSSSGVHLPRRRALPWFELICFDMLRTRVIGSCGLSLVDNRTCAPWGGLRSSGPVRLFLSSAWLRWDCGTVVVASRRGVGFSRSAAECRSSSPRLCGKSPKAAPKGGATPTIRGGATHVAHSSQTNQPSTSGVRRHRLAFLLVTVRGGVDCCLLLKFLGGPGRQGRHEVCHQNYNSRCPLSLSNSDGRLLSKQY